MSKTDRANITELQALLVEAVREEKDEEIGAQKIALSLIDLLCGFARDVNSIRDALETIAINTQGRP